MMELGIEANWRWAGVPFFIRTGKHLAERDDRDRDSFPSGRPMPPFEDRADRLAPAPNWLVLRIAPDEAASRAAVRGQAAWPVMDLAAVKMDFGRYDDWFPEGLECVGYETTVVRRHDR